MAKMVVSHRDGVLITSVSQKVPLVHAVRDAAQKVGAFEILHGYEIDPGSIASYFVDESWITLPLDKLSYREIQTYCLQHRIGAIIPTRDGELEYFAKGKEFFHKSGIAVLISPEATIEVCADKLMFYEKLCQLGLPCIPTYLDYNEVEQEKKVVKERFGTGGQYTGLNLNTQETQQFAAKIVQPIYQPYIQGDEYSIDVYRTLDGQIIGPVCRRRDYVSGGESKISTTVVNEDIESLCSHLAHKLGIYGPCVFQGIVQEDGEFLFLECNPRFGGASSLSINVGLDIFGYFFRECLGQTVRSEDFMRRPDQLRLIRYPQDMVVPWNREEV